MKKRSFIAGMLTTALLFGLVSSAYAAYQKQATLNYSDIKITLDGQQLTPKNAKGQPVEPFIIDGTTYLPVRAVSEALGLDVDWEQKTQTVVLTSPEPEETPELPSATSSFLSPYYYDSTIPRLDFLLGRDSYYGEAFQQNSSKQNTLMFVYSYDNSPYSSFDDVLADYEKELAKDGYHETYCNSEGTFKIYKKSGAKYELNLSTIENPERWGFRGGLSVFLVEL